MTSYDAASNVHPALVAGHGLHCDMRAVPWALARVNPQIPTAVFTSPDRGTGAWLRGRACQIFPAASSTRL